MVPLVTRLFSGKTLVSRRLTVLRVSAQVAAGGRLFSRNLFTFRHVQIPVQAGEILSGPLGDGLSLPSVH